MDSCAPAFTQLEDKYALLIVESIVPVLVQWTSNDAATILVNIPDRVAPRVIPLGDAPGGLSIVVEMKTASGTRRLYPRASQPSW